VRHDDYVPVPPTQQALPKQERGVRPARAVPYELQATARVDLTARTVVIQFANTGKAAAVFQVRPGDGKTGPWTYTVGAGAAVSDTWSFPTGGQNNYDLSVYGPNGFLRVFQGSVAKQDQTNLAVAVSYQADRCGIRVDIQNVGSGVSALTVVEAYSGDNTARSLRPQEKLSVQASLSKSYGWYDFSIKADRDKSFLQQLAGHVESGTDSMSDPALGA
jgi:phospholipase C